MDKSVLITQCCTIFTNCLKKLWNSSSRWRLKNVFWGVMQYSLVQEYWCFKWVCCLHNKEIWVKGYSTLQLDTTRYSNALVKLYHTIQHHISEDNILGTWLLHKIWKQYGTNQQQNGTELPQQKLKKSLLTCCQFNHDIN